MLALAGLLSCSKPAASNRRKIALLPFENLTGDPSLDWVRNAGPGVLGEELAGTPGIVAVSARSLADARIEGATAVLHAYYTREHGTIRLTAELEDRGTLNIEPVASASGSVLQEITSVARSLHPEARAFSTTDETAFEAWGSGDFPRAIALDPDFGAGWLGRVRMLAQSGDTAEALSVAGAALARKNLRSDWSRGELRVAAATIRKDFTARADALTDLAKLAPSDPTALAAAAEAQKLARDFKASAELYRKLAAFEPREPEVLNSLGYAEGYLANLDAAKRVLGDYAKIPGSEANSHDSLGEVYFMNGRFAEAEQEFRAASARNPSFLGGAPLMKAAYAHWLGGDLAGADGMVQKFTASLAKNNPRAAIWNQATWLYATERQDQAEAMLAQASSDNRIRTQLTVWQNVSRLQSDIETLRTSYYSTQPAFDGLPRVLYAAALAGHGKETEARELLKRWPLPISGRDQQFDSIAIAKYLELRKKLGITR